MTDTGEEATREGMALLYPIRLCLSILCSLRLIYEMVTYIIKEIILLRYVSIG